MPRTNLALCFALLLCLSFAGCPPPSSTVTVPSLSGMTLQTATSSLVSAHLAVGNVSSQWNQNVPAGCVASQTPSAGASVNSGTAVNLVISLGPQPQVAWDYSPTNSAAWGRSIQQTLDGGYIVGGGLSAYNMYALKLTAAGSKDWEYTYSNITLDSNQTELWRYPACGIQQKPDGSYIIAGSGHNYQDLMPERSFVLLRLSSAGLYESSNVYAPVNPYDAAHLCVGNIPGAMQITDDGGCVVFGSSYVGQYNLASILKTNPGGGTAINKVINDNARAYDQSIVAGQQTADGGYALAGYSDNGAPEGNLALLIKLDGAGNLQWSKTHNYVPDDHGAEAYALTQTADGGYLIGGELINEIDNNKAATYGCWFAKVDDEGEIVWMRSYGHAATIHYPKDIAETPQGDFVACGEKNGHPMLAKFTADGDLLWNYQLGYQAAMGNALTLTSDGGCAVVASYITGGSTTVYKVDHVYLTD